MRAPRVVVECWRVRAGVGVPGVPGDRTRAFTAAYAADGAWGELFAKATGFLGTELYRDAAPGRPVPDDRPLAKRARLAGVPQRIRADLRGPRRPTRGPCRRRTIIVRRILLADGGAAAWTGCRRLPCQQCLSTGIAGHHQALVRGQVQATELLQRQQGIRYQEQRTAGGRLRRASIQRRQGHREQCGAVDEDRNAVLAGALHR
jgi:hypothetical protein